MTYAMRLIAQVELKLMNNGTSRRNWNL